MKNIAVAMIVWIGVVTIAQHAAGSDTEEINFPLFNYLTGHKTPTMVAYSPSELDPRSPKNHEALTTNSIEADLAALRPIFDGLILYGHNKASTPRIVQTAKKQAFRAVMLGIWNPNSKEEIEGVASLVNQYHNSLALGVIIGNEGILFKRYKPSDLNKAANTLLGKIPQSVPITTSEPLFISLQSGFVCSFGDFMAVNIHPVWDRKDLKAEAAALWTREQALKLAVKAKKPVLVKETGFPHGGRESFSLKAQQDFWSTYLQKGVLARPLEHKEIWVFHGVAFEAFDLPWKALDSGIAIEKSWGLFSTPDRIPHPAASVWRDIATVEKQ